MKPTPFPRTKKIHIFIDFDGTISTPDTLYYLLQRFADKGWLQIEEKMEKEEMDESEGLRLEFDLLHITREEALRAIDNGVTLDPHFPAFAKWCQERGLAITIVSGGFLSFIKRFLRRYGLDHLPIKANRVRVEGKRWRIIPSPHRKDCHKCNNCKTYEVELARARGETTIYIGDGTTDRCPAAVADMVFAKDKLKEYCQKEKLKFYEFNNFEDIMTILTSLLPKRNKSHEERSSR